MGKYHYGLKNVHYYPASWNGMHLILGEGKPWAGAVNLVTSITSNTAFSSDDGWALTDVIPSEELELEIFTIPEDFQTKFLGEVVDSDGNIVDVYKQKKKHFALAFEIAQDTKAKRYLYFYCTAEILQFSTSTKKASIDIEPNKIKISAAELPKIGRKKETSSKTKKEAYDTWFTTPKVSRLI